MSTHVLLFTWTSNIKIQLSLLVWYKADIECATCSLNDIAENYSSGVNQKSLAHSPNDNRSET
jgi:hypothetical protein